MPAATTKIFLVQYFPSPIEAYRDLRVHFLLQGRDEELESTLIVNLEEARVLC